ncbi:MAG: ribosome small subunit-dependent GTPase A [Oceanococcaceae bacterium]
MSAVPDLPSLGWLPSFQQQLDLQEWESTHPQRIIEQHRSQVDTLGAAGALTLNLPPHFPPVCVGDWILCDAEGLPLRLLERRGAFARKAAGHRVETQLIAANVDTALIVCALNRDFNLNRIERYLSLSHEAGAEPVVLLSKADLCPEAADRQAEVQALDARLSVLALDGRCATAAAALQPWCSRGQTLVLLGSSGAGKSTLANTLLGEERQATGAIRADDDKGRHTTTRRTLIPLPGGALLLDTPGMRELQLADCATGVAATFADIDALTADCRFNDCAHDTEPGCAVRAALQAGELEQRRFDSYLKLHKEQALNAASLAQKRAGDRAQGRMYRSVQNAARGRKGKTP